MGSDWYGYPDTDKCDEESVGVSLIVTCEVQQPKEDVLLALKTLTEEILSPIQVN